jgi:hypothetical protein
MRVRMLKAVQGSPDGVTVRRYEAGSEHDLSSSSGERDLAAVFVREGWAEAAAQAPGPAAATDAPAAAAPPQEAASAPAAPPVAPDRAAPRHPGRRR